MLEDELLIQARRLNKDDLRRLIAQARALADLGPAPDEFSGKDPIAVVESLFGKIAREPAKKPRKKT
jgi:hypothetical protein